MKKGIVHGLICATISLFLSWTPPAHADANIYWDFDDGFTPNSVEITPGETVTWWNLDPFGFPVRITFDNSFTFFLPNSTIQGVTFPFAGIYYFHSDYGDNGSVTVSVPTPPVLTLESPRLDGTRFLFDATGLTIGKTNVLQASTNLTSWVAIQTNIADNTTMIFTNGTSLPRRFFRLLELP